MSAIRIPPPPPTATIIPFPTQGQTPTAAAPDAQPLAQPKLDNLARALCGLQLSAQPSPAQAQSQNPYTSEELQLAHGELEQAWHLLVKHQSSRSRFTDLAPGDALLRAAMQQAYERIQGLAFRESQAPQQTGLGPARGAFRVLKGMTLGYLHGTCDADQLSAQTLRSVLDVFRTLSVVTPASAPDTPRHRAASLLQDDH